MALSLLPHTSVAYGDFIYFFVVLLISSLCYTIKKYTNNNNENVLQFIVECVVKVNTSRVNHPVNALTSVMLYLAPFTGVICDPDPVFVIPIMPYKPTVTKT